MNCERQLLLSRNPAISRTSAHQFLLDATLCTNDRVFREFVTGKLAAARFRQGWRAAMQDDMQPVPALWNGSD